MPVPKARPLVDDSRAMAFRALVPYALAAVLVAGASSVAVLASLRGVSGTAPESPASASAAPAAASAPRALPELSKTGRLAYWRFCITTLLRRPRLFHVAVEPTIIGYHFRRVASLL